MEGKVTISILCGCLNCIFNYQINGNVFSRRESLKPTQITNRDKWQEYKDIIHTYNRGMIQPIESWEQHKSIQDIRFDTWSLIAEILRISQWRRRWQLKCFITEKEEITVMIKKSQASKCKHVDASLESSHFMQKCWRMGWYISHPSQDPTWGLALWLSLSYISALSKVLRSSY